VHAGDVGRDLVPMICGKSTPWLCGRESAR
jgi:hypothetical protein